MSFYFLFLFEVFFYHNIKILEDSAIDGQALEKAYDELYTFPKQIK